MAERIGQQLGNYRLVGHLGKGGFAEVYLGEHIYLKTQAAIKLLQTKVANQEDLDSFLKEAQTIAHLVHPHIVRVLDFGVDGETPFLAMDYAPNGTLRQLLTKGRYNTRNIVIAASIIALSVFLGLGFALLISFGYWLIFIELALPTGIFVLIFLPILLIIYNAIEKSRRSA